MKICVLTSSFPANPDDSAAAAGLFVRDFSVQLARLGHEVTVLTQATGRSPQVDNNELDVYRYEWATRPIALGYLRPYRPRDIRSMISLLKSGMTCLRERHRQQKFDHILAMWAVPAGLMAMRLKKSADVPYTVWCLGSDIWTYGKYPLLRRVVGRVLREADHVYADGIELKDRAITLSGVDCSFLPSSRTLPLDGNADTNSSQSTPRFLFVGRYAEVKGVDVLIDAMTRYKQAGGKGHLYMFGGGPLDDFVREHVASEELHDFVSVGGYINETDYVAQLQACDFFLIPSRMESIPVVFSDALQAGKPVIATRVGDMGALLDKTQAGFVVPPNDPAALCKAMLDAETRGTEAFLPLVSELASHFDLQESAKSWLKSISGSC